MDICELLRSLPLLKNYGKDVDLWIYDFEEVMDLWDIQNPKRRFVFMKECVDYALKEVLKSIEENGENKTYPSIQIIKEEIEKYLGITQNDKIWELKEMKIKTNESIPIFNINYIRKYKNIDEEMRKLITVEDYINSIKPRIYPCLRVLEQECENIEEAIKIAEKASRIEEKLKFKIDFNNYKQNYKNDYINDYNNNINKKNNKIMCFRCYELGHKAFNCKYSFKELSIMEEKGIIEKNKRSNYRKNFNKKKIFLCNKNNYNKLFGKNSNNYYYYNNNGNYSGNAGNWNNKQNDININKQNNLNNYMSNNNNNYQNNKLNIQRYEFNEFNNNYDNNKNFYWTKNNNIKNRNWYNNLGNNNKNNYCNNNNYNYGINTNNNNDSYNNNCRDENNENNYNNNYNERNNSYNNSYRSNNRNNNFVYYGTNNYNNNNNNNNNCNKNNITNCEKNSENRIGNFNYNINKPGVEKNVTYASNENKNDDRNKNFEKGYNNSIFNNNNNNNGNNNNNNFICNAVDLK